ncbi:MAG: hypothetical protein A3D92_20715 [Bacteroidetes bacterium RIFCSPHIGHO2_02_FULL_44_7]|nr:MAG: hypothetical protein A3D92_20715 [Bacteroidetes bacterium RIFCSPHIGHO2_02_FULL_44_7]
MSAEIQIETAFDSRLSKQEIEGMYGLMIDAYALTEVEIWGVGYQRMPLNEYLEILQKGEILFAQIKGEIVGTIHCYPAGEDRYSFGLLAANFSKKGLGIGRKLIAAAEKFARAKGAKYMSLEILRPRDFEVPIKTQLHEWYTRQGYRRTTSMSFLERKPEKTEKALQLLVPSVFDCYEKEL